MSEIFIFNSDVKIYVVIICLQKNSKIEYTYTIAVLVMTDIVLVHDQKHVPCHFFLIGPNASPKRTLDCSFSAKLISCPSINCYFMSCDEKCSPGIGMLHE